MIKQILIQIIKTGDCDSRCGRYINQDVVYCPLVSKLLTSYKFTSENKVISLHPYHEVSLTYHLSCSVYLQNKKEATTQKYIELYGETSLFEELL